MNNNTARKWKVSQFFYKEALKELDDHFHILNINYMPIKGAFLIYTGLAEKIKERVINDIDILVEEKDMQEVSDYFMKNEKCKRQIYYKDNYLPTETSFLYSIGKSYVPVEIHSHINFPERFNLPPSSLFARSTKNGSLMHLPSPEDTLLIFICHLLCHIPYEYKNNSMEEIKLLACREGFKWEKFWNYAYSTGVESFIYFILTMYSKEYNVPIYAPRYYPYSKQLARFFNPKLYLQMPGWVKRLFFEIPFVEKPLPLLLHKLMYSKKR